MGWFRFSKYFQMKEPPIPIPCEKKKRKKKEQAGSSWLFSKTSKNQQGFMKEPEVLGRLFGFIQVEDRSCVCMKTGLFENVAHRRGGGGVLGMTTGGYVSPPSLRTARRGFKSV